MKPTVNSFLEIKMFLYFKNLSPNIITSFVLIALFLTFVGQSLFVIPLIAFYACAVFLSFKIFGYKIN